MSYLELLNQKLKCERLYKSCIKGGITFFAPESFAVIPNFLLLGELLRTRCGVREIKTWR